MVNTAGTVVTLYVNDGTAALTATVVTAMFETSWQGGLGGGSVKVLETSYADFNKDGKKGAAHAFDTHDGCASDVCDPWLQPYR